MGDFEARLRHEQGVAVIELAGRLDGAATPQMEALHAEATPARSHGLLIDFSRVTYINSTGIALIVGLAAKAWTAPVPVSACGLNEHYQHIFRITRIADHVSMFADQAAALAARDQGGVTPVG